MRVPHTIPTNVLRAYAASDQTLALQAERYRTVRAEDLSWDDGVPLSLANICVQVLAANFEEHSQVLPYLTLQDFDYLLEILSVDLPVVLVAPIIEDGIYWERCCLSRWPNKPLDITKHGESWKRMYIERLYEEFIEEQEPGYIDWNDVLKVTAQCSPFMIRLEIQELLPPRKWQPDPNPPDQCIRGSIDPDHIDLSPILPNLVNLTELSIKFGLLNCGMKYNPECFRISLTDINNLAYGLTKSPSIKTLRIHRCAIDDIRVNILIEAIMTCDNIEHLEISHCKFGDIGAKSLGKLLITHKHLKSLYVQNNKIGEDGGVGLAYALQHEDCCPITTLNLELNSIKDEAGVYFATAIVKNRTLKELCLSSTGITSVAVIKIAEALLFTTTVKKISLNNNDVGMDAADYILTAADMNKRIETFDVRNCGIGEEAETMLFQLTTRNRQFFRPNNVRY